MQYNRKDYRMRSMRDKMFYDMWNSIGYNDGWHERRINRPKSESKPIQKGYADGYAAGRQAKAFRRSLISERTTA